VHLHSNRIRLRGEFRPYRVIPVIDHAAQCDKLARKGLAGDGANGTGNVGKTHTKPREIQDKPIPGKRQGARGDDSQKLLSTGVSPQNKSASSQALPGSSQVKDYSWGTDLVDWYTRVHRKLPWRAKPEMYHDPYRTWLSEIMLQQTTVVTVIPYYQKFLERWPTVFDLAQADEPDVLREWAGLGYYARGRNLLKGARMVVADYNGIFPADIDVLQKIPGIGPYTASAIGAMAFGLKTVPVDGNVERVMTRICAIDEPLPIAKPLIKRLSQSVLDASPSVFSGDLAQAFMDLGATVCTPKSPKCSLCPVRVHCAAFAAGVPEQYPVMAPKVEKPTRQGDVYVFRNRGGQYLTVRRAGNGLLAGMPGFPTTGWDGVKAPVLAHKNSVILGTVRHSFTHFNLILRVVQGDVYRSKSMVLEGEMGWYNVDQLSLMGLPKLFQKILPLIQKIEK